MADATIGAFFDVSDGKHHFMCFTLEDEARTVKKYGETRIPSGVYEVTLRTDGGFHERYAKYPGHAGMLWIRNVPGFEYVLIHIGNTDDDTAGCVLVGFVARVSGRIDESEKAYLAIYPIIRDAIVRGENVMLQVVDFDAPH